MVWRMLLQGLAQQAIQDKLAERAGAAARGDSLAEIACDVGFVFALGIESGGLEDLLEDSVEQRGHNFRLREGWLDGRRVALAIGGAGRASAEHAAQALLQGRRPTWIVSAGFGGGLDPKAAKFDVVMANEIVATNAPSKYAVDFRVTPEALAATPHVHVGRLVTIDKVLRTSAEKQSLGRKTDSLVVDMETHAVAAVCHAAGAKFMAVRILTDSAADELPKGVGRLLEQKSVVRQVGAAAAMLFRRPSSVASLWGLREDALVASDRLAKFLRGVVAQLAPPSRPGWNESGPKS